MLELSIAQDLILVDPDDEVEVRAILAFHGDRSAGYVKRVNEDVTLVLTSLTNF